MKRRRSLEILRASPAADPDAIAARAAEILGAGGLVAIPTETVYGLAADASDDKAVARIFEAKGRPAFNPLIVHVNGLLMAQRHAEFPLLARRLALAFWPGPLTLVLMRRAGSPLSLLVSAGLDTVAIRTPAHPMAQAIIGRLGRPIAAPSANVSGSVSPTTAAHVADSFGENGPDLIVDCGPCEIGVESTIVGMAGDDAELLRPGGIPSDAIEAKIGRMLLRPADGQISAPGMLASHYAPNFPLRLDAAHAGPEEFHLAFGPDAGGGRAQSLNLSPSRNLREAAGRLFDFMRRADQACAAQGLKGIAVAPIPHTGLGEAINDRLRRAAAPKS
jgi:L-threonylcarbamoyladenylate synthase